MRQIANGWLSTARACLSPNFNERPNNEVSLIVVHNISLPAGQFGGDNIERLFTNCLDCESHPSFDDLRGLEVSAHFLVRRDGEVLQFVDVDKRAWHAGISSFEGRENCNDFSIGIELEGCDEVPYTTQQYQQLCDLVLILQQHFGVPDEAIVGHADIAPGRKTDPGPAFDWDNFKQMLSAAKKDAL